jgi:diaminopimelate epimerase
MTENSVAKYHALGNDYIVVDPKTLSAEMTEDNVRTLCDRNFGVGSDGILYGPLSDKEPYEVRIFNPDGSEAEKSGNGLRIFAKYLSDAGYLGDKREFDVLTKGGLARCTLLNARAELIEVDMGVPSFKSRDIPVNGEARDVVSEEIILGGAPYRMTCVTVGNPHCVIVVDQATRELTQKLGPVVEAHALFPNRINLQLMEVIGRNAIKIEIWERGAGYTLASGSSSCAAAAAAHRLGMTDNNVTVMMPGGELDIFIAESGHIFMRGSAAAVFEAKLSQSLLRALGI